MYPSSSQEIFTEFLNMGDIHQPTSPIQDYTNNFNSCSPNNSDLGDMELEDSITNFNFAEDITSNNNYFGSILIRDALLPQGHQIKLPPKNQYDNSFISSEDLLFSLEEPIEINNNVCENIEINSNINVDEMINIPKKKKEVVKPKLVLADINANTIENPSIQTPDIIEMILDEKSYVIKSEPIVATAEMHYDDECMQPSPEYQHMDQQLPSTSRAASTESLLLNHIKAETYSDFEDSGSEYTPSNSGPASVASVASFSSSTATKRGRGRPAKPIKRLEPASQLKLSPRQRDQYNRERNNEASRISRRNKRSAELHLEDERDRLENRNLKLTRVVQRLEAKKARFTLQMLNLAKR